MQIHSYGPCDQCQNCSMAPFAIGKFFAIFQCSSPIKLISEFIVVVLLESCTKRICLPFFFLIFFSIFLHKREWKCRAHSNLCRNKKNKFFFVSMARKSIQIYGAREYWQRSERCIYIKKGRALERKMNVADKRLFHPLNSI